MPMYVHKTLSRIERVKHGPRYVAAHHVRGIRSDGRTEWDVPATVHCNYVRHRPKLDACGKIDAVREVPEALTT